MATNRLIENDHYVQDLSHALNSGEAALRDVPGLLRIVLEGEGRWQERIVSQTGEIATFGSFLEFVETRPLEGLGGSLKVIQKLCEAEGDTVTLDLIDQAVQRPVGTNQHVNHEGVYIVNTQERPVGNTRSYSLRHLRDHAPDVHAEVLAGSISPHAGMVKIGARPKTITVRLEVESAAKTLRRNFSADELQRLKELL